MTIQEIAREFDMNFKEFSECIGYSRVELYKIASGKHEPRYSRVRTALNKLVSLNEQLYENEKNKLPLLHIGNLNLFVGFSKSSSVVAFHNFIANGLHIFKSFVVLS